MEGFEVTMNTLKSLGSVRRILPYVVVIAYSLVMGEPRCSFYMLLSIVVCYVVFRVLRRVILTVALYRDIKIKREEEIEDMIVGCKIMGNPITIITGDFLGYLFRVYLLFALSEGVICTLSGRDIFSCVNFLGLLSSTLLLKVLELHRDNIELSKIMVSDDILEEE